MSHNTSDFAREWESWHARRLAALTSDYGWLSLTSLTWLDHQETPVTLPDFPGTFSADLSDGAAVTYRPDLTGSVRDDHDQPVMEARRLTPTAGKPVLLFDGDVRAEVIARGDRLGVRVRDPRAAAESSFDGIPSFEPQSDWVVDAQFEAYDEPRETALASIADTTDIRQAVGVAHFSRDGHDLSLEVYGEGDGSLSTIFGDATSGLATYGAGRFLTVGAPESGTVRLDFNRAYNPPCTVSPYCTCPLAPARNRLPIEVNAGEKFAGHDAH